MTSTGLRTAGLVVVVASTAGCESEQQAVPLAQSLPVALFMFVALPALWIGAQMLIRHVGRALARRLFAPAPVRRLRWPRLTAAFAAAPVVIPVAVFWAAGCVYIAVGFEQPTYDLFAWDEWVVILAVLGAIGLVLGLVSTLVASALWSGRRRGVLAARWILGLVALATSPVYVGLLWLPALVLSFITASSTNPADRSVDPFEVGGVVQPHQAPTPGWAPPGLVGVGAEPLGQ